MRIILTHCILCPCFELSQSSPPKGVYTNKKKVGIEHGHATWFFSFCIEIQRMWKTIIIIILIWSFMNGHLGFPIHSHLWWLQERHKKYTRVWLSYITFFKRYFDLWPISRTEKHVVLTIKGDCHNDQKRSKGAT